ncbi:uncharacterized protein LY89DRAFT_731633 [Mollisia scopiformis]|uniref:Uncharacterized protein n=1 Tax=Mollisia scopiformis TaxID=149040 RepID=A0A194XGA0_MOLSC|nr:uncharacterized protein LY89DRAFT_731633 [Mollisia scopiformis]KUJ19220.1 hypothetical protein LY89DRAFT_731633 [Mollisia scopiformis]
MHGFISSITLLAAVIALVSGAAFPEPTSGYHETCLKRDSPCGGSTHINVDVPCCDDMECVFTYDKSDNLPVHVSLCLPPPPGWSTPPVAAPTASLSARGGNNYGCDNFHCVPPYAHPARDVEMTDRRRAGCGCDDSD